MIVPRSVAVGGGSGSGSAVGRVGANPPLPRGYDVMQQAPSEPVLLGGRFASSYPTFTEETTETTFPGFVQSFAGLYHNPNTWASWLAQGHDVRLLNPAGMYMKHLNIRELERSQPPPSAEGHPNYNYIDQNHPEWIVKDINGNPVPLFLPTEECLDFGNDAFLDWVLNTWMPEEYLDTTDSDPNRLTFYLHDNGNFTGMSYTPNPSDPISVRYTTDEGVRSAWVHFLDRFRARWPNKKITVSSGPNTYMSIAEQMEVFQRIFAHADGFFSETLTNDNTYWSGTASSGSEKRIALETMMQMASWLADNGKFFYPNCRAAPGITGTTQTEMDYGWAFFNLMRKGDKQFFAKNTKDGSGNWVPMRYAEMDRALGNPTEDMVVVSANVYRRTFENAIAYVNLSDASANLTLPGGTWETSLDVTVNSPLVLPSFSGLTIYGS